MVSQFFRLWKGFEGREAQAVFKLSAVPLPEATVDTALGEGLKFAILKGVDPNPANFVAAAKLANATNADGTVLVRLEVNAQAGMCRASVRSPAEGFHGAVAKIIAAQLGTPA